MITANSLSPGPIATNLFRYHSLIDGNSICPVFFFFRAHIDSSGVFLMQDLLV
jgi:hypothetical protein